MEEAPPVKGHVLSSIKLNSIKTPINTLIKSVLKSKLRRFPLPPQLPATWPHPISGSRHLSMREWFIKEHLGADLSLWRQQDAPMTVQDPWIGIIPHQIEG
ncbi:hypothetical protein CEXT_271681 [Caerostris extrusa]|uniref:Uncharacterized protein n=1 Tax=Caerostris extrusa TaxID=172846 RepID=A0AAV4N2Q7_CAEEX|nr:hypothetical protein CEXT_271681 [Caerostris extrusa]